MGKRIRDWLRGIVVVAALIAALIAFVYFVFATWMSFVFGYRLSAAIFAGLAVLCVLAAVGVGRTFRRLSVLSLARPSEEL